MKTRSLIVSAALAAALAIPLAAGAQSYPSKPIRVLSHNPPTGPADTQMRAIASLLTPRFGQPIVIENRPGGDGVIAATAFVRSAPDGYTLFLANQGLPVGNLFTKKELPYTADDLVPVVLTGEFRSLVIVHPSLPAKNMNDVIALAKAKPGSVAWSLGSSSPTTASVLFVNWFKATRGVEFLAVPYKSTTEAMQGVLSGQVALTIYAEGPAAKLANAGKVRAIAASGQDRSAAMPEIPSFKEQGIDLDVRSFYGLYAPRGTPDPIIQRLNTEVRRVMEDAAFQDKFVKGLGMVSMPWSSEQFAQFLRSERAVFAKLAELLKIQKE